MTEQTQLEGGTTVADEVSAQSVYTVQVECELVDMSREHESDQPTVKAWVDIGTFPVPPRTHRKRLITRALLEAGIKPVAGQPSPRVRVLDEESAAVVEPEPFQPDAEWRV